MEEKISRVTRSELRQNQSKVLSRVSKGRRLLITSRLKDDRPIYLVDQEFLDELTQEVESLIETLDILMDETLTERLLKLKSQVRRSPRSVRLIPFDKAFSKL